MKVWLCISFAVVMSSFVNATCIMLPETKLVVNDVLLSVTTISKFYALLCV